MGQPVGTYLAQVRSGSMQLPPIIADYARSQGWTLFRFVIADRDHVLVQPVLPGDSLDESEDTSGDFHASLDPDGKLWIPQQLREKVRLAEQSVMLRVENGFINMYLRKVFETLGFRPA